MSSSVFFKFKSQKEPSRVTFDGTGITVFDLKREIITINRLGDGSDFNLAIYNQDTNEEYKDDTTVIPRSTSIIARRLPPSKPGRGTAQRYVTSKMPNSTLNAQRTEKGFSRGNQGARKEEPTSNAAPIPGFVSAGGGDSEEDKIAAMFQANSDVWNKTQEQMANATPVHRGPPGTGFRKNNGPAPTHPPPSGYICYRCGEKGHWIQVCPTNSDPTFDGRPRVKRTTGIPRSFLKTVEKPVMPSADVDDATTQRETPSAIMVNAEGEYVVAEPDKASWESYQQKAAKSSTKTTDAEGSKELQELGLECTVDHKLIKDAVKTPCCGKVYCEDCIQNLLFETDFVCPNCDTKDILLDRLVVDTETREKVEAYEKGIRNGAGAQKPKSVSPTLIDATNGNSGTAAGTVVAAPSNQSNNPTTTSASNQQKQTGQPIQSVSTVIPIVKTAQLQQQQVQPQQQQGQPLQQKIPSIDSTGTTLPISKKRPFEENEDSEQLRTIKPQPIQKYPQPTPPQPIPSQQYSQNQAIYNRPAYSHQNQFQPGYNNYNQYPSNGMNGYYGNGNGPNHYAPPNGGMMGNGMNNGLGMNMGMGNMGNMGMGQNAPTGMGPGMNMNMRTGMGPNTNGMGNGMGGNMVNGPQNMGMNGMGNRVPNMMAMGMNGMGINGMGMNGMGNGMMNGMPNGIMGPGNMNQMNSQMGYQYGMDPSSYYFSNQQKTVFSEAFPSEEESAYIRKPVNPHRHARPKRIRPSDFKALGGE